MTQQPASDFAPFEQRMRAEQLPQIVIDNLRYYYDQLVAGAQGFIPEEAIEPIDSVTDIADLAGYAEAGQAALGRAAMLKLNGGLGTSMGLERAKSLLPVREGLNFLDLIARQNLALRARYGSRVPLLLMNSFSTDADSRAVLDAYPQLAGDLPLTVMQHKIPKVDRASLAPAEWAENQALEWCPPGHGEVYVVLRTSGALDALLERGYEFLFISNVDNLGATLDLGILGYLAQREVPFLMEVAHRTEADKKGGHIARQKNGQLVLREVAQCPEADLDQFQDIRRHRFFNTNNIWVNLRALSRLLDEHGNVLKLPMIRNVKTVDPKDSSSPEVVQLETAMGAAIGVFPGAEVLSVGRDRFLPVKTCADLLGVRSDIYTLDDAGVLRMRPERRLGPIAVALDQRYYKQIDDFEARFPDGPPSLIDCARLQVEGDLRFEAGVVLRGAVQIVHAGNGQGRVPAGTLIADTRREFA
ncbi:MAG TPA: UTP--glucose-1-phosphate uridylyltransferase [Roseiflexaceae bacterium]|nr:UTP--glucose-1-phosphate uridylyltransferase [Roseiflexaceae bacterium]